MARSRTELDPRFRRLMQRLPAALAAPISAEIRRSAVRVMAAAVARVPVDTGDLKKSIGMRVTGTSAEVGFDPKRFRRNWKRAGWRAKFTELGTKGSASRNIPPQPPRPFLRPAFESNRQEIIQRHRRAIAAVLSRAATL
jgi:HK97 gp10 family phage protein